MTDAVKLAFEGRIVMLPLDVILPLRRIPEAVRTGVKYRRIVNSVGAIGVIEPLAIAPAEGKVGTYLLLDGHLRHAALAELGIATAPCLLANDDEAFTYNKRLNRLATIQEHYMVVRAIERGVSVEKLARYLNLDVRQIQRRRTLLDGICGEVGEMFKDKNVNPAVFDMLRKMKPIRQIEAVELMIAAGNYSSNYAKALLAATKQHDLVHPERPKKLGGMTPEQMARMEREMETLQRDFKAVESSYGDDVLHLVIASGYLGKLLSNARIDGYLGQRYPEVLEEFKAIINSSALDQAGVAA